MYQHHGRQVPVTPAASAAPAEPAEPAGPVASPEDSDVELTFDEPLWHSAGLQHEDGMKTAWRWHGYSQSKKWTADDTFKNDLQ